MDNRDYTQELAEYLNVPRAQHPLDGGTHVTRQVTGYSLTFEQVKEFVDAVGMTSVYEVEAILVKDPASYEDRTMWKVRGIFK